MRAGTVFLVAAALALFGVSGGARGVTTMQENPIEDQGGSDAPAGCGTFPDPADAQDALDAGAVDPAMLDPDENGVACDHGDPIAGPIGSDAPPACGMYPDPKDAQNALASGTVDVAEFDPDGDGIACNHDEAQVGDATDDGSAAPADGGTASAGDDEPGALPRTGTGQGSDATAALARLLALVAALSAILSGAARASRKA